MPHDVNARLHALAPRVLKLLVAMTDPGRAAQLAQQWRLNPYRVGALNQHADGAPAQRDGRVGMERADKRMPGYEDSQSAVFRASPTPPYSRAPFVRPPARIPRKEKIDVVPLHHRGEGLQQRLLTANELDFIAFDKDTVHRTQKRAQSRRFLCARVLRIRVRAHDNAILDRPVACGCGCGFQRAWW